MTSLKCELLHSTSLWLASNGCRMSHDSLDKSDTVDGVIGPKDKALIDRIGNKLKHESILEFINFTWDVEMDTKTLMSFSRHRVGVSLTMRSTRYTTSKLLKNQESFISWQGSGRTDYFITDEAWERSKKFIVHTGNIVVDTHNINQLEEVRKCVVDNYSDDEISMLLPQAWIYRGQIQMNGRSLKHYLTLRSPGTHAHIGAQDLSERLINSLPTEYKYLFESITDG